MPRLVALDLPGGPTFVNAVRRCLDAGDAIWPVDQRISDRAKVRLYETMRPSAVVDEAGEEFARSDGLPVDEGDLLVVATSGTSGEPKGVVLTASACASSARATSARLGVDPHRDHWLCCLPLSHIGGLSVIIRAVLTETALTVLPGFNAEEVERAADEGATMVSLVPTALRRLSNEAVDSFRVILLGGSAPPDELPPNAVTTYGMTETGSGIVYDGEPLDDVEIDIAAEGEISVHAPMLLRSYRDGTDPKDEAGWLRTGDVGRIDDKGRLVVDGRLKEVIVTGGENVWPQSVESVLARHPAFAEVGVVGVSDAEWGERVIAAVVLAEHAQPPALEELQTLVRDEIAPFAVPKEIVVVDALPRTSIGKLRRFELSNSLEAERAK